jgi:hypothetical protein
MRVVRHFVDRLVRLRLRIKNEVCFFENLVSSRSKQQYVTNTIKSMDLRTKRLTEILNFSKNLVKIHQTFGSSGVKKT